MPAKSRFDGFVMSGKLTNIENEQLLTAILALYQTRLLEIQTSEGGWTTRQRKLREYREEQLEGDDERSLFRVTTTPKGKRLLRQMATTRQLYQRYQSYIELSRDIIRMIDAAYPEQVAPRPH